MSGPGQGKISFKRSIYMALAVLCIYYPVTISANIPFEHWKDVKFLALPAISHFVFYVLLIVAIDRVIDAFDNRSTEGVPELQIKTIILSLVVAVVAVVVSQLIFRANIKVMAMVVDPLTPEQLRGYSLRPPRLLWNAVGRTNYALTFVMSLSIFYVILNRKSYFRMRDMEVQAEQLKKENAMAQFEALKNQVSPHFLFNSLSILSSLVHVDPNLSEKFIDRLSKAYRYILEQKDNETVSLKTELEFLHSYAFLLKIRFENKFDVKIFVSDDEAVRYQIAPLTLQLLIENCVKHNSMSEEEPLIVTIRISDEHLVVTNPVRKRTELERASSTGVGLVNIRARYKLLTALPVQVEQTEKLFTVTIPLL